MAISMGYNPFEALNAELESLLAARDQMDRQIEAIREKLASLRSQPLRVANAGPPLRGLKVAVVGPSFRESLYRQELGQLGATVLFASSEIKLGRVAQICGKAHGIIYITTFTGHAAQDHVMAAARRRGIPLVRLPFTGIGRLRQAAIELAPAMSEFKEMW